MSLINDTASISPRFLDARADDSVTAGSKWPGKGALVNLHDDQRHLGYPLMASLENNRRPHPKLIDIASKGGNFL